MTEQKYAHYTDAVQAMEGYVNGATVKAACGIEFVPSNDPKKFPVCPECQELYDIREAIKKLIQSGQYQDGIVITTERKTNE